MAYKRRLLPFAFASTTLVTFTHALAAENTANHSKAVGTNNRTSEDFKISAPSNIDFQVFHITTDQMSTLGESPMHIGLPLINAVVQALPNIKGSGQLCKNEFVSPTAKPCDTNQILISFVSHPTPSNAFPPRGECFCVSKDLLKNPSPQQSMSQIPLPSATQINVFDDSHSPIFQIKNLEYRSDAQLGESLYARKFDHSDPSLVRRFIHANSQVYPPKKDETEYKLFPVYDAFDQMARSSAKSYYEQTLRGLDWKDYKTGAFLNPLSVGIDDLDLKKEQILSEYVTRSAGTLGQPHGIWATFHNAWKLARLTRNHNEISLQLINDATKAALDKKFNNPKLTARMMLAYEPLNKYIWHDMHALTQKSSKSENPSLAVDKQFTDALNGTGHDELWKRIATVESEFEDIQNDQYTPPTTSMTLSEANAISNFKDIVPVVPEPSQKLCRRAFTTDIYDTSQCPCQPKTEMVPCNFELPSLRKSFVKNGVTYGIRKTYLLVNESQLPDGLKSSVFSARRTGYSRANNTPANSSNAGFAAVERSNGGKDGIAHLGRGTLDSPITAAISPAAAKNYGICQGDMLHDPDYGWLRVEGGCTTGGLGTRVDVWRGNASTRSLSLDDQLNRNRKFRHFPAGLVDADYAIKHPK